MPDKDKHESKEPEHVATDTKVPHKQAAEEGVKAAPPHPLLSKMQKLLEEVANASRTHREAVLGLRDKLSGLMSEAPANMPGQPFSSFHSLATRVEEEINKLDPDCSARA